LSDIVQEEEREREEEGRRGMFYIGNKIEIKYLLIT